MTAPLLFLAFFWFGWAQVSNVLMYRYALGVESWGSGRPLGFWEQVLDLPSDPNVIWIPLILAIAFCLLRLHVRWWTIVLLLPVIGTPAGMLSGRIIILKLWRLNVGTTNESFYPDLIALCAGIVGAIALDVYLDWRLRKNKLRRAADILCPICGYDLRGTIAAGSTNCSECGKPFELVKIAVSGDGVPQNAPGGLAARPQGAPSHSRSDGVGD